MTALDPAEVARLDQAAATIRDGLAEYRRTAVALIEAERRLSPHVFAALLRRLGLDTDEGRALIAEARRVAR